MPDGGEVRLVHDQITVLASYQNAGQDQQANDQSRNWNRVIYRCLIGSRAYGLETEESDMDRRGVYLPRAEDHWSLAGVPEQIENDATQEVYWEIQKLVTLGLKANPNILECLYSPKVEFITELGTELLSLRDRFLSKLVYQTFNGYVLSQFKKMQTDLRNHGTVKWKPAMHLIRLLLSGAKILRTGTVDVEVGRDRDALLAIKRGELSWDELERWRYRLHAEFEDAFRNTKLPDRPDYDAVNQFLIHVRRTAARES